MAFPFCHRFFLPHPPASLSTRCPVFRDHYNPTPGPLPEASGRGSALRVDGFDAQSSAICAFIVNFIIESPFPKALGKGRGWGRKTCPLLSPQGARVDTALREGELNLAGFVVISGRLTESPAFSKYDACDCCPTALIYEQTKPVLSTRGARRHSTPRGGARSCRGRATRLPLLR